MPSGKANRTNVYVNVHDPADAGTDEVTKNEPLPAADTRSVVGAARTPVAVSTATPTQIIGANANRKQVKITNTTGTQIVWLGSDNGVSSARGDYLAAPAGSNFVTDAKGAIWGLSITAAQTLAVYETEYAAAP